MRCIRSCLALAVCGYVHLSSAAQAQSNPLFVNPDGIPAQIIPTFGEVGITWGTTSGGSVASGGGAGTSSQSSTSVTNSDSYQPGSSNAVNAMLATNYGSAAADAALREGVSVEAVAAIGQAESGFRNVPTANGSSSATGPWQFTAPTFLSVSQQHGLGYTTADVTNPQAQAVASAYLMHDYATTVSQASGQPATTLQTYGAWVFGTQAGANIATASPTTPLSDLVSAQSLSNNGMTSWTVSQFRQVMSNRLGSTANQPALTSS